MAIKRLPSFIRDHMSPDDPISLKALAKELVWEQWRLDYVRPRRGRPKAAYHAEWIVSFKRHRDELNGDGNYLDGEKPLNNIELSQLVVDELELTVTARAVWAAVKPFV
jgi:hypothetical protein